MEFFINLALLILSLAGILFVLVVIDKVKGRG